MTKALSGGVAVYGLCLLGMAVALHTDVSITDSHRGRNVRRPRRRAVTKERR